MGYGAFSISISYIDNTVNYKETRKSIIRSRPFRKNIWRFWGNMESNMMNNTSGADSAVPTGLFINHSVIHISRNKFLDYSHMSLRDKVTEQGYTA